MFAADDFVDGGWTKDRGTAESGALVVGDGASGGVAACSGTVFCIASLFGASRPCVAVSAASVGVAAAGDVGAGAAAGGSVIVPPESRGRIESNDVQ